MKEFCKFYFILKDTVDNFEEFLENPNIVVTGFQRPTTFEGEEYDRETLDEYYFSLHDRIYRFSVTGICQREKECENVYMSLNNALFTISYNSVLNYLEDKPLFDKR